MRPSLMSRRQSQTPSAESNDSGSNTAEQNIPRKRKAPLATLENISAHQKSLNQASQREVKRRGLGSLIPQKGTVKTVQSEIASDHGWGVGIGTMDHLEEVINSLLYPEPPPQVFSPPIDLGGQPEASNALNEGGSVWDLSEYLILDEEGDQPESLDTEMTTGSQGTELSDIVLENLSITELLNPSSDFGDPANVLPDLSLDFLDEWTAYDENAVSGNQSAEANHAGLSSGVWEILLGQKGRINHGALQHFIEITSPPDLKMSERALREAFKKSYKNEACPGVYAFKEELRKLRAKKVENTQNQPTRKAYTKVDHKALQNFIQVTSLDLTMSERDLREAFKKSYKNEACPGAAVFKEELRKLRAEKVENTPNQLTRKAYTKVDHKALQNFIKVTSLNLTMSARDLREAFKKSYKNEACPGATVFKEELRKLRAKKVESTPNQPTRKAYTKVDHTALQNFIKVTSLNLTMSSGNLRQAYIKTHGEKSCPATSIFDSDLQNLRAEWAKANPGQPTPWQKYTKVDYNALHSFIELHSPDLTMSVKALRKVYIKTHGEGACPSSSTFYTALKNLEPKQVKES